MNYSLARWEQDQLDQHLDQTPDWEILEAAGWVEIGNGMWKRVKPYFGKTLIMSEKDALEWERK